MIQRFELTAVGMNVSGTYNTDREHFFPIASLLANRALIYDGEFMRMVHGMVCLFCRTIHLYADRTCTADL